MRRITIPACLMIMLTLLAHADGRDDYKRAMRNGAKAKLTVHVVDDNGHSISNATCHVGFADIATIIEEDVGHSDANGLYVAEGIAKDEIGGWVEKKGYYRSHFKFQKGDPPGMIDYGGDSSEAYYASKVRNGRWLPWNPTIPVVLRDTRNPTPMFVKKFDGVLPNGTTVGFDCEVGDFTHPHGNGKIADFTITLTGSGVAMKKSKHSLIMASLDPAGGFHVAKLHQQSAFKSDYQAPEQGYSTNVFAELEYDSAHGVSGSPVFHGGEYLVYKSRIMRDADGNILSANYGKFYSGIEFMRGLGEYVGVGFLYYFNPKPNDPNLEFDGKHNLFLPQYDTSNHAP